MESVLPALIILFILIFGVLTFSETMLDSQDQLNRAEVVQQEYADQIANTRLHVASSRVLNGGAAAEIVLENQGSLRFMEFAQWDVIIEYTDIAAQDHILWLSYVESSPLANQWSVEGLYLHSDLKLPEQIEPRVFNPGEELVIHIPLVPALGVGSAMQAVVSTGEGVSLSTVFLRNIPPVLEINAGLTVGYHQSALIDAVRLFASDGNHTAEELHFTITRPPTQGQLSMNLTFTQADIKQGLLRYTHTGAGPDTFEFTVTDGIDTIGPFVFTINVLMEPLLVRNALLSFSGSPTATITHALLATTDGDDLPEYLIYSVIVPPSQGTLSLGDTFTQRDIDNGLLTYTRTSGSFDSFQFSVTDGETVIGIYTFTVGP